MGQAFVNVVVENQMGQSYVVERRCVPGRVRERSIARERQTGGQEYI